MILSYKLGLGRKKTVCSLVGCISNDIKLFTDQISLLLFLTQFHMLSHTESLFHGNLALCELRGRTEHYYKI